MSQNTAVLWGCMVRSGGKSGGKVSAFSGGCCDARQSPCNRVKCLGSSACRSLMSMEVCCGGLPLPRFSPIGAEVCEVCGDSGATAMPHVSGCRSPFTGVTKDHMCLVSHWSLGFVVCCGSDRTPSSVQTTRYKPLCRIVAALLSLGKFPRSVR